MASEYLKNRRLNRQFQQSEIAERAGVSISTVSRVLNSKTEGFISNEKKQRVLKAVQDLKHESLFSNIQVKLQHIGFFVSNKTSTDPFFDPFHASILKGVEAECRKIGLHLSYTVLPPGPEVVDFVLDKIQQNNIDGIIFLAIDDKNFLEAMWTRRIPLVLVNSHPQGFPIDTYLPDNWDGGKLATRYLIEKGHRNIVHLTDLRRWTIRTRHAAYRNTLEEAGIPFNQALVVQTTLQTEEAYQNMQQFLANKPPEFSAIFCANDLAAIGAARALREKGLQVPEDVSIVSFDDAPMASYFVPPLTTIRVEQEEMGSRAVRGLLERAANPSQSPIKVELGCRLVERGSVRSKIL